MIDQTQYVQARIDDQISWYEKKSRENKNWFMRLRIISIILALSIPVLTGFIGKSGGKYDEEFKLSISLAGVVVAFIEGLMSLKKYHDLWTGYRSTSEGLKYNRYLFEAGAAPYDTANAFQLLVQNSEGLMATERAKWVQVTTQQSPPAKGQQAQNEATSSVAEGVKTSSSS